MMNKLKRFTVNNLEKIFKKSGLSDKSIGVMIRSYHFAMPLLLMLAVLLTDRIIANIAVLFFIGIVFLFIIFNGCFLSTLEKKFCKDEFNIVDPLLEITNQKITDRSRMGISYFILFCYTMVFFAIYYLRFLYNKPFSLY